MWPSTVSAHKFIERQIFFAIKASIVAEFKRLNPKIELRLNYLAHQMMEHYKYLP